MPEPYIDPTAVDTDETKIGPGVRGYDARGVEYVKCGAGGTITDNAACVTSSAAQNERDYLFPTVIESTDGDSEFFVGWNKTGGDVSSLDFFWAAVGRIVEGVLANANVTVPDPVYVEANGQVSDTADGTEQSIGHALTTVSGGTCTVMRNG